MNEAQTVGTRSLVVQDDITDYCHDKRQVGFVAERFSNLTATDLDRLIQTVDAAAASALNSRLLMELTDVFCLRRDLRYGLRSRKWLFARGQQTGINSSFAGWAVFVREHMTKPDYLKSLIAMSATDLSNLSFTTIQSNI